MTRDVGPRDSERSAASEGRRAFVLCLSASVVVVVALLGEFVLAAEMFRAIGEVGRAQTLYGVFVVGLLALVAQAALLHTLLLRPLRAALARERELVRALDERGHRDGLTGALNRIAFEHLIVRELETLKRYGAVFCAVMLDVDGFRRVNEQLGYETGDRVLVELARLLAVNMRRADLLFRWRSGRFLVLAAGIDERQALLLAEKLARLVADHAFRDGVRLTLCAGVAQALPADGSEQLMARVKSALGLAKERGPGHVVGEEDSAVSACDQEAGKNSPSGRSPGTDATPGAS